MLNPRPDEAEAPEHYPEKSYDPFLHPGNCRTSRDRLYLMLSSAILERKASVVMKGLSKPASAVRVLETGCSTGRLLMRLHTSHAVALDNLWGIEPDPLAREVAKRAGLTQIVEKDNGQIPGMEMPFDRIVFWHSLEHLHRIGESLEKARLRLAPDGMLIIALPNIDSDDARRYGSNWIALDAPRHLYHFSVETLKQLLRKHGFSVLDTRAGVTDALYNAWYSAKLECEILRRHFGLRATTKATLRMAFAVLESIDPLRASAIVTRAVRSGQDFRSAGTMRPSDFSSSTDATR
jgi:SAM-dependent methyltransferase